MHPPVTESVAEIALWKGLLAVCAALWGALAWGIKWGWGRMERRVSKLEEAEVNRPLQYVTKADLKAATDDIKERVAEHNDLIRSDIADMRADLKTLTRKDRL